MKKIHMIAALLAMLLPTVVWGGNTYYYKMHLTVSSNSTGKGLVYAKSDTTELPSGATFVTETTVTHSRYDNKSVNTGSAFAKANYGYVFKGWSSQDNSTTYVSTANPYTPVVSSSATSESNASTTDYYAVFDTNPDSYTLTLNKPEGLASYTVTGPDGFSTDLSQGGSATVYKGDQYSFKYTLSSDEYDFINWTVNGEQKTSNPVSVTISGNTTVVLTLKKKVTYTATCQGSVGGTYKANGTTVSGSDYEVSNFGSVTVSLSNPVANSGYTFYGWYILHPNGVKEYLSYYTSVSTGEKKENITVGAEFREVQDCTIDFIAPVDGKITYAISGGNSGQVEGANVSETVPAGVNVTLTAISDFGSRRAKWYTKDDHNRKTYFSIDNSLTKTFASSVALGVDFIPVNTNIVNAIEAAQSSATQEAILTADAEIVLGTSVEIPAGITIDLNGHTLYVDGTLTVKGTLTGGKVSKCTKLIRQTGNGLEPIVADNISYWDTRIVSATATVSGYANEKSHLTIVNGYGNSIRGNLSNSSPAAIVCDIDLSSGAAVNTITNFVADYVAIGGSGGAILSTGGNSKLVVQLTPSVTLEINDFPSGSGWRSTSSGKEQTKLGKGYRIDCAHNNIVLKYEVTNASVTYFINAGSASRTSGLQIGSTENFINCGTVSQRINANNAAYAVKFNVYDCGNPEVTFDGSNTFSGDNCGVNFRSGGPYTIPSSGNSNYHVFGGFYTSKPDTGRIAKGVSGRAFYQHADTYWYLEENLDKNVAEIGGIKKYALIEAFQEAITGDVSATTITLLRDCSLDEPVVIPADRSIRLELAGCTVTAPNGFIVNHGSFEIGDKYGSLTFCGVVAETGNVFVNEDGGRIVVAYGKYDGGVLLKAGSEFTTHHGNFTGAISFGEGVAVKASVAKLYGGKFSTDVADCLCDGYQQVNGYVGLFPYADIQNQSVSGYEFGYQVQAMTDRDLGLYNNSQTMRDASYTAENWFRRAQLYSQSAPYLGYSIDCVIGFDRDVSRNSVMAYGKTTIGQSQELSEDVAAGVDYRVLSAMLASRNQYQKSYSQFITEESVRTLICAVKNNGENANRGTLCVLRIDLCSGANKYDVSKLKTIYTIGRRILVFGSGSNKAMIRPATGAATFYATLNAAFTNVLDGGTVMLANDCTEKPYLYKEGSYIFDPMGFEHSFSGAEGGYTVAAGLSVTTEIVDSSVTALIPSATAIKYVVSKAAMHPADYVVIPSEHLQEWESENGITTGSTESEIRDALKQEDENGIAKWENVVMGQESAHKPAIETSTNGTAEVAEMVVSFKPPSDIGYTVKYAFDRTDSTGTVYENGAGEAQATPELHLTDVKTAGTPSYFKMRAVLESDDDKHAIVTNVPVEKMIGVLKVDSDAEYTIIAVPWKSFGDGDVKVSELVHAASLSEDDMITAYDNAGNSKSWRVKDGVWVPVTESEGGQQSVTPDPAGFGLARGKGVWLKRSDSKKPIYLMGQPTTETAATALTAAENGEPSWNLVASPKLEPVDIASEFKDNVADEIIVPTAGTPKHYTYKNGAWGYPGAEKTITKTGPGGKTITIIQTTRKTDDTSISPGKGFWYLNKGTEQKTINW